MSRNHLLLIFLSLLISAGSPIDSIDWQSAEVLSKEKHVSDKKYFVKVYTDWCGWCRKMDKTTFQDPEVIEFISNNFIAVALHGERDYDLHINGQKYATREFLRASKLEGYPTIIFLDKIQFVEKVEPGYKTPAQLLRLMKKITK